MKRKVSILLLVLGLSMNLFSQGDTPILSNFRVENSGKALVLQLF